MTLPTISPWGSLHDRRYNKVLQKTYPDCRVRWSEKWQEWLLERKANYARTDINPAKYPAEAVDTFIQRRDGYYLAGRYAPKALPPAELLVKILLANDTARMDVPGATPEEQAANWCQAREDEEAARIAKGRRDNSFEGSGAGAELYEKLAWEEGRRIAVPKNATGLDV